MITIKSLSSSSPKSVLGRFPAELALVIAFIVVYSVVSHNTLLKGTALLWWADLAWTIAALATAIKCFKVALALTIPERLAWYFISLACFSWFLGMIAWDYFELVAGQVTPFPAISDFGFMAFAPFFMVAFVIFRTRTPSRSFTMVQVAKLGILVLSIVIIHLIILLEVVKALDETLLYVSAALAYPVLYMSTLIYAAIILWHYLEEGVPKALLLVVIGFSVHAVVDSFYAYGLLGKTYEVGNYLDILWLVGFGFIYWGALARQQVIANPADDSSLIKITNKLFSFDALVPVLAVFFVLLVSFLYVDRLTPDTIQALFPFAFLLVVFIGMGEIAGQLYQAEMQKKLASSEKHLSTVLDTIPYGVQEIDKDGYVTYSNWAHDKLFGYEEGTLQGYQVSTFFADPKDGEELIKYLKYLAEAQPEPTTFFAADRKKDNSLVDVQVDWDYRRNSNGDVIGFISILTDITAKRQAEEQLRQAAAVFESTSEAVMVTDPDGKITAVNQAFTVITGYSEDEVIGKNPKLLRSERHESEFFNDMWSAIKDEGGWRGEVWDRRKNGEIFPVWQAVSAIKNDDGEVTHYVSVFTDISTLKQTQEQLNYLAYHDPLTDLPNRLLFNDRLMHAIERAARSKDQVALLFIDLDNFKNVNDSLGHPVGDELLLKVASRLRSLSRKDDTVARISGDEFVIILENIHDAQDTVVMAQKLINAFQEPLVVQGHELHITLSIGISIYPRDGDDVQTLVRNADAALYRAKAEGRNDFYYYTEELTTSAVERLKIESALRNAVKNQELVLYYQPQISLDTGLIVGVEALIRWQHPELGLLMPNRFINLAEDTGLIVAVGEWVLTTACGQMKAWQQSGYDFGRVAVNVSGLQLQRGDFQKIVNDVLLLTHLEPQSLELEITENFIMNKPEKAIAILDNLKSLGIQIAIDDFGTGYSSLSYLKRLPVDKLKIDGSFVRDIPNNADDEAIARAVVALAKNLQLKVIAEGVETREQREFLTDQDCDEAQGYLISKPLPPGELISLVDQTAELLKLG